MDVSSMLSTDAQEAGEAVDTKRLNHQYPTRHAASTQEVNTHARSTESLNPRAFKANGTATTRSGYDRISPAKKNQKHVSFLLIDSDNPHVQARLVMRVMIATSDTTEGIITTVKNFYGLYDYGVSFEDVNGMSLIANYDNFEHNMTVYVRAVAQKNLLPGEQIRDSASPKRPTLGAPFEMRPPQYNGAYSPAVRSTGARSMSPQSDAGHRSASAAPGVKSRPQRTKSKDASVYGDVDGYSSGDNGGGSVASSRRSKAEVVNPEISTDNIVEGGRRKMAFQSSELPLFVPPQVPMSTSISSISPQRRAGPPSAISPHPYLSNQRTFTYTQPLPSPQSYGSGAHYSQYSANFNGYNSGFNNQTANVRARPNYAPYGQPRHHGSGILPTPDPTVGSAISDEDAALQLMRLNKPMAFSHGRTSTSTVDDAMSGKADAASSEESSEDEDGSSGLPTSAHYSRGDVGPQRKKQRTMNELPSEATSEEYEDERDGNFEVDHKTSKAKGFKHRNSVSGFLGNEPTKPRTSSSAKPKSKSFGQSKTPASPSSIPAPSRKGSIASLILAQHAFGADEDDLSSKPRCQRCRKSKKGCDRQRPCGRCKDAGIGIEGCVSEDEGNGRKGRYGRHMGVSIKKAEEVFAGDDDEEDDEPAIATAQAVAGATSSNGLFLAPAVPDKNKKRKR